MVCGRRVLVRACRRVCRCVRRGRSPWLPASAGSGWVEMAGWVRARVGRGGSLAMAGRPPLVRGRQLERFARMAQAGLAVDGAGRVVAGIGLRSREGPQARGVRFFLKIF